MKVFSIKQHDSSDCGVACLYAISKYYRIRVNRHILRTLTNTSQDGVSIKGIVDAAKQIGLNANAYEGYDSELFEVVNSQGPCIAHLENNHFVVVWRVLKNKVVINNPAVGIQIMSSSDFNSAFSGYWISFQIEENIRVVTPNINVVGELFKENKVYLFFVLLLSIIIAGISFFGAYVCRILVDAMMSNKKHLFLFLIEDNKWLNLAEIIAVAFFVLVSVNALRGWLIAKCVKRIDLTLCSGFFKKIFEMEYLSFSGLSHGDYVSRLTDAFYLRDFLSDSLVRIILNGIIVLFGTIVLLLFNAKLFLIVFITLCIMCTFCFFMNILYSRYERAVVSKNAVMQATFIESLKGYESIIFNNKKQFAKHRIIEKLKDYEDTIYNVNMFENIYSNVFIVIGQFAYIGIPFTALLFVYLGEINFGEFIFFYIIMAYFVEAFMALLNGQNECIDAWIAFDRLLDIYYVPEEKKEGIHVDTINNIRVEKLAYAYPEKKSLFNNLNVYIESGDHVCFSGKNGSGKSTIIKLILAVISPNKGKVFINGLDIENINKESLRNRFAYVGKDGFIIADTFLNNCLLGNVDANENDVMILAEKLGFKEEIECFPRGVLTFINENGDNLSTGQRQMIFIIRAFLRNPDVIIFDEALNNIDSEKRKTINNCIKEMGCIFIETSHDLSSKMEADVFVEI